MSWAAKGLIVLVTALAMEGVAYAAHRWIMHGFGWGWHRDHHEPHEGWFEYNDLYAVVFGGLAFGLILADMGRADIYWIGIGMTLYGLLYSLMHDGLVHQRYATRWIPRSGYLKRLVQAHRMHHAVQGREHCVSFGFLYAPPLTKLREQLRGRL